MKLFYTINSPFARIVRAFIIETGLEERIETAETTLRDPDSDLLPINPVGRVPTLVIDDGVALTETTLICAYLDRLHDRPKLMPEGAARPGVAAELAGQALGFLEGAVTYTRECRRPAERQLDAIKTLEIARVGRCLDHFESRIRARTLDQSISFSALVLGAALATTELRHPEIDWRAGHPQLANWYTALSQRPSMVRTAPLA